MSYPLAQEKGLLNALKKLQKDKHLKDAGFQLLKATDPDKIDFKRIF
jgi:hypothetical protein